MQYPNRETEIRLIKETKVRGIRLDPDVRAPYPKEIRRDTVLSIYIIKAVTQPAFGGSQSHYMLDWYCKAVILGRY